MSRASRRSSSNPSRVIAEATPVLTYRSRGKELWPTQRKQQVALHRSGMRKM